MQKKNLKVEGKLRLVKLLEAEKSFLNKVLIIHSYIWNKIAFQWKILFWYFMIFLTHSFCSLLLSVFNLIDRRIIVAKKIFGQQIITILEVIFNF